MIYVCGRCPWKCRTDDPEEHHTCLNGMKPFFNRMVRPGRRMTAPSP